MRIRSAIALQQPDQPAPNGAAPKQRNPHRLQSVNLKL
jgi:hypothetical protein